MILFVQFENRTNFKTSQVTCCWYAISNDISDLNLISLPIWEWHQMKTTLVLSLHRKHVSVLPVNAKVTDMEKKKHCFTWCQYQSAGEMTFSQKLKSDLRSSPNKSVKSKMYSQKNLLIDTCQKNLILEFQIFWSEDHWMSVYLRQHDVRTYCYKIWWILFFTCNNQSSVCLTVYNLGALWYFYCE